MASAGGRSISAPSRPTLDGGYMDSDLVAALTLARKLHLGILRGPPFFAHRQVCMTVQCGCDCKSCKDLRAAMQERGFTEDGQLAAPLPPAQPWETRKAA